jgi:hypothetical protein
MMTSNHSRANERAYWEPKPLFEDPLYEPSLLAVALHFSRMSSDEERKAIAQVNKQFIESIPQRLPIIEEFLQRHKVNISLENNDYAELEHFIIDNIDPYTNPVADFSQRNTSHKRANDLWISILTDIALHILYKKQELNFFPIKWHPLPPKPAHYHGFASAQPRFSVPGPIPVKGTTLFRNFTGWGERIIDNYTPKHRYYRLYDDVMIIDNIVEQSGNIPLPYTTTPLRTRKPKFSLKDYETTSYVHLLRHGDKYTPEQKRKLLKQMTADIPARNKQVESVFQKHRINIDLQNNNLEELEVFLIHHIDPHEDPELENEFMDDQWTSFIIDVALYCGSYKVNHNKDTTWKIVSREKQPELALYYSGKRHLIFDDFFLYGDRVIIPRWWIPALSSSISLGDRLADYETDFRTRERVSGDYFPTEKFAHLQ